MLATPHQPKAKRVSPRPSKSRQRVLVPDCSSLRYGPLPPRWGTPEFEKIQQESLRETELKQPAQRANRTAHRHETQHQVSVYSSLSPLLRPIEDRAKEPAKSLVAFYKGLLHRPNCRVDVLIAQRRPRAFLAISGRSRAYSVARAGTGRTNRSSASATAERQRWGGMPT
jgi:hypothetical protein